MLEIGLHHEQQHQELLLTDILHAFAQNPVAPAYDADWRAPPSRIRRGRIRRAAAGIHRIGFAGDGYSLRQRGAGASGLLQPARIARGLVTNAQWLEFMADGGYATPSLWLSDGWATVEAEGWSAPGYWREHDGAWLALTLGGLAPIDPHAPVMPRELLRGRRVRALGRQASADRGGMGGGGARRSPRRCLRHRLAMDPQRLSALSGLSRRRRRARRIQRQVHGQPDGAARQLARHARRAMRARATAISSIRRRAGSSAACGCWITSDA